MVIEEIYTQIFI